MYYSDIRGLQKIGKNAAAKVFTGCNFLQRLGSVYALLSLKYCPSVKLKFVRLSLNDSCKFSQSFKATLPKPEKLWPKVCHGQMSPTLRRQHLKWGHFWVCWEERQKISPVLVTENYYIFLWKLSTVILILHSLRISVWSFFVDL